MQRGLSLIIVLFLLYQNTFAQLPSPEQFLGYKIGTRYTPHWKVVDYFKQVAAAVPNRVKVQAYGKSVEGRPLIVAYIAQPEHMAQIENIRQNNLRLAGLAENNANGTITNAPAIVWLSYNVHGNEASSSEAAMLTLYYLADPKNNTANKWLKNIVVIMDPCLNPDGRERYINWFQSVVGSQYNPDPNAREHREPWPGGRTNHYNFDLNRDWAWQTQIESQQRMKLYNSWLPQVHVDFHEQGYNSPYYFAPAAQPYHEVITPWQRTFQDTIGRYLSKQFDQNNWLYFTKEVFDLLYPSYGDTYPIYNGAIGMTYEQGGIASGLGVITASGDTLTLADRVLHHYTTGLSTIEVAANNAGKLLSEYQNFFHNAITNGVGDYKSYIIKYTMEDAQRIDALLQLLRKNKIDYGKGKAASLRGFNYDSGREEAFTVNTSDIIIPSLQPKSALVKVLFEPNAKLVDSVTYDITAWSLPYVYGVKAYATHERLNITDTVTTATVTNMAADTYGYIIPWSGIVSAKLLSQLLQKGIKVRYSEVPFVIGNQSFNRGSLIILKSGNQYYSGLWDAVRQLADSNHIPLTPVNTGFADKGVDFGSRSIIPVRQRRIAIISGEGVNANAAGEAWFLLDQELQYPVTVINTTDMMRINWSDYDVLILPDGNYRFLSDKTTTDVLRDWVNKGGNVVAMENAVAQLSKLDWTIKQKKSDDDTNTNNPYEALKKYGERERDMLSAYTPGSIFKVTLDNTHPLAFGYPAYYYTLKQDDHIYNFIEEGGWNVGVIKKEKQVAGFVGSKLSNRLQDGLLFGVQDIGRGTITYLADDVLFRSFWQNGKLLFCNAVFFVGQ